MKRKDFKIYGNSVVYTYEGITGHFREEMKQMLKRGYDIFLTDPNYNSIFGTEYKDMYTPIDWSKDNAIIYCNQPPFRQHNLPMSLMGERHPGKLVYFLAFEGNLPAQWVQIINDANIDLMLVPSQFNKDTFISNGVKHDIEILPHGVDVELYKPSDIKLMDDDDFLFLWVGTNHNDRKGFREMVQAWKKFSRRHSDDEKVHLVLKINNIYGMSEENRSLLEEVQSIRNVITVDQILPDESMAELFKRSNVYISTSISEGYGMNILQAMACGIPVLTTNWSGNAQFCTIDNVTEIPPHESKTVTVGQVYGEQEYPVADIDVMIKLMEDMRTKFEDYKERAMTVSSDVRTKYNWEAIGDRLEAFFIEINKK